jgi:hypothetical protein
MVGMAAFGFLLAIAVWVQLVAGTRTVRILTHEKIVEVGWRNAFFTQRRAEFPLNQFHAVVSYIVPGRFPKSRVELVDASGTRSLLLVAFPAGSSAVSFWSFPRNSEAEHARNLRLSVVLNVGLKDRGFIGSRFPGTQVL